MRFARRTFLAAGVMGIAFVLPMYFLEGRIARTEPPPITHPEYFYGFIGVTLAWQVMFLLVASNPIKYRPVMLVGVFEKVGFGLAMPMLFAAGRIPTDVFVASLVDLAFAVLFAIAYGKTPVAEGP